MRLGFSWLPFLCFLTQTALSQTFVDASHLFESPPDQTLAFSEISVADFDSDGRSDIYHLGRFYRQTSDGRFVNVLPITDIKVEGGAPIIALPGDPDADGLLDVLFVDAAPGSRYYQNVSARRYSLANSERNLNVRTRSIGAVWGDFDTDGYVDILVAAADGQNQLYVSGSDGLFTNVSNTKRTVSQTGGCSLAVTDFDRDGDLDAYIAACNGGGINSFLQYDSVSDRFSEVASRLGVVAPGRSTSAVWLDFDNDGWQDLFVVNTRAEFQPSSNLLFRNRNGTSFQEVGAAVGVDGPPGRVKRRAITADFDNDGWTDIYVTGAGGGHKLFLNNQDGTFRDVSLSGLLPDVPDTEMVTAADVNDDGWIDLLYGLPAGHRLFLNSGAAHWITVSLRSPGSNRLGLGARVELRSGGMTQTKVMVPGGGNPSHDQSSRLHFGLGPASMVDQITVTWPDGQQDFYTSVPADGHRVLARGGSLDAPPAEFVLTEPVDAAFVDTSAAFVDLSWTRSQDTSPVTYTLGVTGPGVRLSFPGLTTTSLRLSTALLAPNQIYTWYVVARDGLSARPSAQERSFSFGNPDRASASLQPPAVFDYGLPQLESGVARFLDLDRDLDLDLFVAGVRNGVPVAALYRANDVDVVSNTDGSQFIFKGFVDTASGIEPVFDPRVGVGDLDGDGFPDFVLTGRDRNSGLPRVTLFRNVEGNLQSTSSSLKALWGGPVTVADVDGDGDGDVLISGTARVTPPYDPETILYRNNGSSFTEWARFPGALFGAADWADADSDGDLDLLLMGEAGSGLATGGLYRNDGDGFAQVILQDLALLHASGAWGDFDGDGNMDLVASGGRLSPDLLVGTTILLRQVSPWTFQPVPSALDQLVAGGLQWGDYEGDGDLDLILSGARGILGERIGRVFRNQGGQFVAELDFAGTVLGGVAAGDYNLDGDLDFLVLGLNAEGKPSLSFFINQQVAEPVPASQ